MPFATLAAITGGHTGVRSHLHGTGCVLNVGSGMQRKVSRAEKPVLAICDKAAFSSSVTIQSPGSVFRLELLNYLKDK